MATMKRTVQRGTELGHRSFCPSGEWKGELMEDIPAWAFFEMWTEGGLEHKNTPIARYIRRNMAHMEREYPDGIWRNAPGIGTAAKV